MMRSGALNKVTNHSPLLDDDQAAVLFSIFNSTGVTSHRMIIELILEHLQIVSVGPMYPNIIPDKMIVEMIQALSDE
jgi:hypothetical protein